MTTGSLAKLLAIAVAVVAAVLAAATVGLRYVADTTSVRAAITAVLAADGSRSFTFGGVQVGIWPQPAVTFERAALTGAGPAAFTASTLTANLQFWSLLAGRVEISSLELDGADLVWTAIGDRFTPDALIGSPELELTNSKVTLLAADGRFERLEDVQGELRRGSTSLKLHATARLRGEPIELSAAIGNTAAFARGNRSGAAIRAAAPTSHLKFEGQAVFQRGLQADGTLVIDGSSLRAVLAWFDFEPIVRAGLGRFALRGEATLSGNQFSLRQAVLDLDGNRADGGLSVRFEGNKPIVQATLATETLNLDPYLAPVAMRRGEHWSSEALDFSGLSATEADIRLSAARIVIGQADIGGAAGAVLLRGGRLSISLGEAEAFSGTVRGTVALAAAPEGAEFRLDAVARDIDLDRFGNELFGARRFEGRGSVVLGVEGRGGSAADFARTLKGEVKITSDDGALVGVNLEQILRRIERKPLSGTGDLRGGRTLYDKLAIQLRIADGMATCEDVAMEGSTVRVALAGAASVTERRVDLKGVATLLRSSPAATFELPFTIRGAWDAPSVVPDGQALIRRSGAAAPLLGGLRERIRAAMPEALQRPASTPAAEPEPAEAH